MNDLSFVQAISVFYRARYDVTAATTVEEVKKLGEAGFEKYDKFNGTHPYRKPKRFVSLA